MTPLNPLSSPSGVRLAEPAARHRSDYRCFLIVGMSILVLSLVPAAFGQTEPASAEAPVQEIALLPIPMPALDALDGAVKDVIESRHRLIEAQLSQGADDPAALMESYGELGFLFHAHELWESALVCYENAQRLAPRDPRWSYAGGLAAQKSGNLEKAAELFEFCFELLPQNLTALVALAEVRLEQNMPLVARAHLLHALELSTESPAALALLGQVALSTNDYGRAVSYLVRALDQVPEADRLHYPLGLAYRGLGQMEKAKEHLAKRGSIGIRAPDPISDAIEERKTGERVMILEGRRAFAAKRYQEAVVAFEKALASNPESIAARVNLATAKAALGDLEGAKAEYRKVLEQDPANSASSFNLGTLLLQENKVDEAVSLLQSAVQADVRDAESRGLLAKAYASQGKLSEALSLVKEASALNRSDPELIMNGYRLMDRLNLYGDAKEWLQDAHRTMPEQAQIAHALANLLATSPELDLRDGALAVTLATQVAQATGDPNHWLTLSRAFAEAGQCADAAAVIRKLLEKVDGNSRKPLEQYLDHFEKGPPCRL